MEDNNKKKNKPVKPLKVNLMIGIIAMLLCVIFAIIDGTNKLGFFNRDIFSLSSIVGIIVLILFLSLVFCFFFALIKGLIVIRKYPFGSRERTKASEYMDIVNVIPIFILIFLIIDAFILSPVRVSGTSMLDTLNDKELLLTVHTGNIKKDDIVVICKDDGELIVKRVVAVPGDKISVSIYGRVMINGELEENSSYYNAKVEPIPERTLEKGEYYVLGDNRNVSSDSRVYGVFTKDEICGKVIFSLSRFKAKLDKKVTHYHYLN